MWPNKPISALNAFNAKVTVCKKFADSMSLSVNSPIHNKHHREMIIEVAFLQTITAWERFIESSFLLYATGKTASLRYCPKRKIKPPTKEIAHAILLPEGRPFADWLNAEIVGNRAKKFFKEGDPFTLYLGSKSNCLKQVNSIRNAIAHSSLHSEEKLEDVIKIHVGHTFNMKAGDLLMRKPNSSLGSQQSIFDYYLEELQKLAKAIVP